MNNIDENRVKELAYQIWESEGRPHGSDKRHWEMATSLAQTETEATEPTSDTTAGVTPVATPPTRPTTRTRRVVDRPVAATKPARPRASKE